jgi:hypothetical protein
MNTPNDNNFDRPLDTRIHHSKQHLPDASTRELATGSVRVVAPSINADALARLSCAGVIRSARGRIQLSDAAASSAYATDERAAATTRHCCHSTDVLQRGASCAIG